MVKKGKLRITTATRARAKAADKIKKDNKDEATHYY
jgi:hypothetical protein